MQPDQSLDIKCLMYHGIIAKGVTLPPEREVGAHLYDVSLENFTEHIDWLLENRYSIVKLENTPGAPMSGNKVILTFDDGVMNNFMNAFGVLRVRKLPAYFFIIVKRVGKEGYMGWEEIKKLHNGGMMIGSHGLTHEVLTNLNETQVEEELSVSKKTLERNLNIPIESLSIPRGFCNKTVIDIARQVGYKTIFVSDRPANIPASEVISRIPVKGNWTLKRFKQAIAGETPFSEVVGSGLKKAAKTILRESGYNGLRSLIIKMTQ